MFPRFLSLALSLALLGRTFALPIPTVDALGAGDVVTCGTGATLVTHDADVAFLALGPGGIAGTIEFLRVDAATTSGTSGGATITAQAVNGGTTIDASKGRLEQGFEPMIAQCGAVVGSTVLIVGGAKPTGNILLTVSAA